ncbi:MAG: NAD(P)/FAD-dependent oxidoreductase [Sphaerochaetaceae bacterium]|nr:NAD(P)/FAD-dependent oxidoreductase [Sphaerochaetaceae bacterium]
MEHTRRETLIIGAGLSGLTAAAYLSRAGHPVRLLERTGTVGGLVTSFTRSGYLFDTGARSIENSGIIRPMLKDLGIELELLASPVTIGVESQMVDMASADGIREYRKVLESLYPDHTKEVRRIFRTIIRVYREMQVIYGFENPVFKNYRTDRHYLFTELLPWVGRFLLAVFRMERMQEPIDSFLTKFSSHQSLNDIIGQHFFKRTPAFFALGYFYVYGDYLYPKGGTGELPESLAQKVLDNGGVIQREVDIISVDPGDKTVRDSRGNSYSYDTLIWCADQKSLYRCLDTSALDEDSAEQVRHQTDTVMASRGGDSVFSLFLGVDIPPGVFGEITNAHLFYTPTRQGLGEVHLTELKELLDQGNSTEKGVLLDWVSRYCELTTYEVSIPSLRDSSLSPEGKTALVVSFFLEYDLFRLAQKSGWEDELRVHLEQEMIRVLNTSVFKGLLDTIELQFSSSPLTIEKRFNTSEGGITGWTFEKPAVAVNRLMKIASAVKTPLADVYQAGQWTYTPAGIPTAILTGWYAADTILHERAQR